LRAHRRPARAGRRAGGGRRGTRRTRPGRSTRRGHGPVPLADLGAGQSAAGRAAMTSAAHVPGAFNAITDVPGVRVGQHHRVTGDALGAGWATGTTVVDLPGGATAAVDVRGGGPGT